MKGRVQLHALTVARGIAAWMVVFFHIRGSMPWLPGGVMAVLDKGYLAVDFFFLLSGFVITFSSHDAFARQGLSAAPAFLKRRGARIYPLYATMLCLTIAFTALLALTGRNTNGYPLAELPLHIAMLQNWGFTGALSWNHPAWSISTEMAAYLLFPFILLGTSMMRAPRWALLTGLMMTIGTMAAWLHMAGLTELGQNIPHYGLARCLFEFTGGCMLCAFWLKGRDRRPAGPSIGAGLIIVAAIASWIGTPADELWAFPVIAACTIFLLATVSESRMGSIFATRPASVFIYLGEISYATYLCHFMLFIWFKIAFVRDAADMPPVMIALFLTATLSVSIVLYHMIEKPGRRFAQHRSGLSPAGA